MMMLTRESPIQCQRKGSHPTTSLREMSLSPITPFRKKKKQQLENDWPPAVPPMRESPIHCRRKGSPRTMSLRKMNFRHRAPFMKKKKQQLENDWPLAVLRMKASTIRCPRKPLRRTMRGIYQNNFRLEAPLVPHLVHR